MASNYLVAVLPNRMTAEAAYEALEKAALPMQKISVLGRGMADEFGLINPDEAADEQSTLLAYWTIPFGFVAGVAFSILSGLETFSWAGEVGNYSVSRLG